MGLLDTKSIAWAIGSRAIELGAEVLLREVQRTVPAWGCTMRDNVMIGQDKTAAAHRAPEQARRPGGKKNAFRRLL